MSRITSAFFPVIFGVALLLLAGTEASAQASGRMWVFFSDRDRSSPTSVTPGELGISERALWRRAKVLPPDHLLDERDLPVSEAYLQELKSRGFRIRAVSRWFNAVSVDASPVQVRSLENLPFVHSLAPVAVMRRREPQETALPESPILQKEVKATSLDYGHSFYQLDNIHVVELHDVGMTGRGIIIGMIDDGYNRHQTHQAMKDIKVLAEYDFIHRRVNTSRESWEPALQGNHGSYTLSALGGYSPGYLIGPAFGATFILAKTEMDSVEVQTEEDLYVEALEWEERLGADIVSTSLGYDDLDPEGKYNPGDILYSMKDGHTAITSLAASIAASKGILLVTAMGNEGPWVKLPSLDSDSVYRAVTGVTGSLITPADADSIVSVGATYSDGLLADFSSTGPAADDRVKPEVVAQGVSVMAAKGTTDTTYVFVGGTSMATPLTAGAAALVLAAHPTLTPTQLRQALIGTATEITDKFNPSRTAHYPNNFYGYGMVNASAAAASQGLYFSDTPVVVVQGDVLDVYTYVNSTVPVSTDSVQLHYQLSPLGPVVSLVMMPTSMPNLFKASIPNSTDSLFPRGYFSASNARDGLRFSPWNTPDSMFQFQALIADAPPIITVPESYTLSQNYPNPFNSGTRIVFGAPASEMVELIVYNLLGQRVATLYRGLSIAGTVNAYSWNGVDDFGRRVASGVYVYQLRTPNGVLARKMLLLK